MVNRRLRRFRPNRNQVSSDPHRYQPFARDARPPQHPKILRLKKSPASDSRDDDGSNPRSLSRRDQDESGGYSSDGSLNSLSGRPYRNNDPITVVTVSLKQSLKIQKQKLGMEHPDVTKAIHSLALEYKTQGKLNKSVQLLKEGIEILDIRLKKLIEECENCVDDDDSRCSTETRLSVENAPNARRIQMVKILEEKSAMYSCLGNIYRMRKLFREALDYYVRSCDMLVEAGYSGESRRVTMLVRIMRRTEVERTTKAKAPVMNLPTIQRINIEAM